MFDKIQASIMGEKVFTDNWKMLADVPEKDLDAFIYAKYLVNHYHIKGEDLVIGHSLGAWVALYIKQLVNCRIIQIAGFTNRKKVIKLVPNRSLLYWLCKRGWGFNRFVRFLISALYPDQKAKKLVLAIFDKLKTGDKILVTKQLKVVYNPVSQPVIQVPDLRIHSKKDFIVEPPDEPFIEVPGDHFTLYTYPETVAAAIVSFIKG